jgi:hypothetical protein
MLAELPVGGTKPDDVYHPAHSPEGRLGWRVCILRHNLVTLDSCRLA